MYNFFRFVGIVAVLGVAFLTFALLIPNLLESGINGIFVAVIITLLLLVAVFAFIRAIMEK